MSGVGVTVRTDKLVITVGARARQASALTELMAPTPNSTQHIPHISSSVV